MGYRTSGLAEHSENRNELNYVVCINWLPVSPTNGYSGSTQ